jgi:FecR protein/Carboxypeptidase regulatory-like domain
MKPQTENPRQVVDRFLAGLGEPLPQEHIERSTGQVLERLRDGDPHVLSPSLSVPRPVSVLNWGSIAAGVLAMLAGTLIALLQPAATDVVARSSGGELYLAGTAAVLRESARIQAGRIVRAGPEGAVFTLLDRSQIEMGPHTELSVVSGKDGLRVLLTSGNVIVTAAKQKNGHLYVETRDCVISVVGTVFTVNTEESGSRISVIEGKVQVQRGDISQTLLPGQQVTTSPTLSPVPLNEEIEWSRRAAGLTALVQQSVPPPQIAPKPASQILRGVVKQGSGEGIPDVTVTLCPAGVSPEGVANAYANLPPGRFYVRGQTNEQQTTQTDGDRKTYFFAVWDAVICTNPQTVSTDSQGRFQFSDVAPGQYIVSAEREGYLAPASPENPTARRLTAYYSGWSAASSGRRDEQHVTIEAGQAPLEISLNLVRGGIIAGRILDPQGRPAVTADVRIAPRTQAMVLGKGEIQATTNDRGEYRAFWLLPGEYVVVARAAGTPSRSISRDWAYAVAVGATTSGTWFPRGATVAEATPVVVREGEEVSNIDIVLREIQADPPRDRR